MTVFHEIYEFQCKSRECLGNTWNFQTFLQNYRFPGPARPACARPYKTNAFSYILLLFGAPGLNFHKFIIFCENSKNDGFYKICIVSTFCMQTIDFAKSRRTQKHQCFLGDINDFTNKFTQDPLFSVKSAEIITF